MNDPKLYEASTHGITSREVAEVLRLYINRMSWKTGERVLDAGCGPGTMTTQVLMPRLPADFSLLVGADMSADTLHYANSNYKHPKLKFTHFDLVKDVENTSQLQPSTFDKIFSFYCLNWIPDQRYCLAVKPGFHS
jgi:juvenile hormone acid methyltransferase